MESVGTFHPIAGPLFPGIGAARAHTARLPDESSQHSTERVSISTTAQQRLQALENGNTSVSNPADETSTTTSMSKRTSLSTEPIAQELRPEEQRIVEELRKRDRDVRAHEQAHLAAAGRYARGGAQFTYQVGPDGKRYAVGGEVPIDVSEVPGDPRATLQKAATIRRAALAPAHPSSADLAVASQAARLATKAHQELLQEVAQQQSDGVHNTAHTHAPGEACESCQVHGSTGLSHAPQSKGQPFAEAGEEGTPSTAARQMFGVQDTVSPIHITLSIEARAHLMAAALKSYQNAGRVKSHP
jgi:SprA-related family